MYMLNIIVTVHAILTTIVQQTGTMNRSNEPLSTDNQQLNEIKLFLLSIFMHQRIDCNIFRERIMLKKDTFRRPVLLFS